MVERVAKVLMVGVLVNTVEVMCAEHWPRCVWACADQKISKVVDDPTVDGCF